MPIYSVLILGAFSDSSHLPVFKLWICPWLCMQWCYWHCPNCFRTWRL